MNTKKVFISSGEASGDGYAALLINEIKNINSDIQIFGMGGKASQKSGMNLIVNSEKNASIMGFFSILTSLSKILKSLKTIKIWLKENKPDAIILIDFPDFNFQIAKYAYKLGIPVYYFIPPQVWAWRKGRIKFLKKYINKMTVLYPFEERFYKENGVNNALFLGHPFIDEYENNFKLTDTEKRKKIISWGLDPKRPIVSIFPGSRKHEINNFLNLCIDVFKDLKNDDSSLQAVISVAPNVNKEELQSKILSFDTLKDIKIIKDDAISVMQCSTAGLQKSGTNNFQACICGLPFLMFYNASKVTEFFLKHFLTVKEFSIVNILRPHTVKEFLQEDLTKENLAKELKRLLYDIEYRDNMIANFKEITRDFNFNKNLYTSKKIIKYFDLY